MSLIVGVRQDGESSFVTITLADECFELGNEGSVSSEFGSDSFSDKVFELEHQDRGPSDIFEIDSISGWIEELKNSAVDLETIVELEDLGGSIDWDSEPTTDGWDRIAMCLDFHV